MSDVLVWLVFRPYLCVPLVALYAFPRRRWIWFAPLLPISLAAQLWSDSAASDLADLMAALGMLLAAFAPMVMLIGDHWRRLRRDWIFWLVAMIVLGYLGFRTLVVYQSEAYLNPDSYCWNADLARGPCEPSPWLLAQTALGNAAGLLLYLAVIPAIAAR